MVCYFIYKISLLAINIHDLLIIDQDIELLTRDSLFFNMFIFFYQQKYNTKEKTEKWTFNTNNEKQKILCTKKKKKKTQIDLTLNIKQVHHSWMLKNK